MLIYLHAKFIDFLDMKRRIGRKFILYFLFNCLAVIPLNLVAQKMIRPLDRAILLSGNFGELRATHFHSGIDIRTGGVEGLPVLCVKDGCVARVSVSPTGYGRALYIEHSDGVTTVYGHLQRFAPRIEKIVHEIQYSKESFRIDEDFRTYQITFRQGDTIAYSGNTGSSGGPHLHFEVRDTKSERSINPLYYYKIRDTKPPVVRKVYLYAITPEGYVELIRQCPVRAVGNGRYEAGQFVVPAGNMGVGVFVTDYMEDSWNKLGVYRMSLMAGQDTIFSLNMDTCSFEQSCFINEVKDFDRYKKKETVYRCFGNYQEQFLGLTNRYKGQIQVKVDSVVPVKIVMTDINGNLASVSMKLKGRIDKSEIEKSRVDSIFRYNQKNVLSLPGCRVELEDGTLFSSVKKVLRVEKDSLLGRDIFILSEKDIPLFKKAHLFIDGDFCKEAVICELTPSGQYCPVETKRTESGLVADIGYLNRYIVVDDREVPEITFYGKFPDQTLRFKIKDRLSGIATYRGEVNGKWCLFFYDPRVDLLYCSLSEPVFQKGQVNEVKITVADKVGNQKVLIVKVRKN